MKLSTLFVLVYLSTSLVAQKQTKRVLFIGNSYTGTNNLPSMFANVANSTNDTIIYDNNTPGGYTYQLHTSNSSTLAKIAIGNWDYVVLQEQSQLPSFSNSQVRTNVFPFARTLDSLINVGNSCAETVFYMTWGRKNGDASNCQFFAPLCTYQGMDSLLNLRYRQLADSNEAIVSPVGAVWNHIRTNYPLIDLYRADESHPSVKGTYAAACTFYASVLRKDPTLITFNSSLSVIEANQIKAAAKAVVYDSLLVWHIGEYDVDASYNHSISTNQVTFTSDSSSNNTHFWDFGDSTFSTLANPVKTYLSNRTYPIKHFISDCSSSDSITQLISIVSTGISTNQGHEKRIMLFPNPTNGSFNLKASTEIIGKHYQIFDLKGSIVKEARICATQSQIELINVNPGIYFFKIVGTNTVDKLVVQ